MVYSDRIPDFLKIVGVARSTEFAVVVAFEYYDGPESGIALLETGQALRFKLIADSKSQLFRAFLIEILDGHEWRCRIPIAHTTSTRVVWLCDDSETTRNIKTEFQQALGVSKFIGIGDRNLECLATRDASKMSSDTISGMTFTTARDYVRKLDR
jgi:hypothetical protein